MRKVIGAIAAAMLIAGSTAPAMAGQQCKDAKGRYTKCPEKPAAKKAPCKDAKGRYTKCK
jgi:hypothetical protein